MDPDTVIGKCRKYHSVDEDGLLIDEDIHISDLKEPYKSAVTGLQAYEVLMMNRIAELEAKVAKLKVLRGAVDAVLAMVSKPVDASEWNRVIRELRQAREAVEE